jgi:2-methylisocitrate lyase-like PEP mutase family enzyme
MTQSEKAARLLELHHTEKPLILPNAWDVASARIFEDSGFPAIATTSAGIANALGYPDGQRIPRDEMLEMVARIARSVAVPVTADMEAGYGDAAATARGVIEAGAVGFNLEDANDGGYYGLFDIDGHCESIRCARAVANERQVPLVINARTDVYLFSPIPDEQKLDEAVRRFRAYTAAGADSLFAPGAHDEATIAKLVAALDHPLNILATAVAPPISRLRELGVARVSLGSGPMRAAMGLTRRLATELRATGSLESMIRDAMSYPDANSLFMSR